MLEEEMDEGEGVTVFKGNNTRAKKKYTIVYK